MSERRECEPRRDPVGWDRRKVLEQQLHDGPALRLSALALRLGVCRHRAAQDPKVYDCLSGVQDELHKVLQELRELAGRIYPPMLAAAGLAPALEALAERHGIPVRLHVPAERLDTAVEAAAYFEVAERLSALSDGTAAVTVSIRRSGSDVLVAISPDEHDPSVVRIPCE
ncbi:histidine kinase [Saccharopolyspora thermophila]|uniref:histidine kinase n=1 Tax=Saccharopolyspora thermophila TaxID=89367 RepID=A0ABN1CW87_9PSEU